MSILCAPDLIPTSTPSPKTHRAVVEVNHFVCLAYENARVPGPGLVDLEGLAVGDDGPDLVHGRVVGEIVAEDERGGHDAPCCKVRLGLSEVERYRVVG